MNGSLYLAGRNLGHHWRRTVILVLVIALTLFLPATLKVLVRQGEAELRNRAAATPLLIGAKGSPVELVLSSLYFSGTPRTTLPFGHVSELRQSGLATPIPLHVRHRSRESPIVGTSLDYFDFRGLTVAEGTQLIRLGDCVVGANVAKEHGVRPGNALLSSTENVFRLTGDYPLKMRVTGILAPADSPDDNAIFVDIKTAWIMDGLAHGHEDLARPEAEGGVLTRTSDVIVANASVMQYREVTDANIHSFHFHGEPAEFPITALIAAPNDAKSGTLLQGRYTGDQQLLQILEPTQTVGRLMNTVFTVQHVVVLALSLAGLGTFAVVCLVFLLSRRLREREFETMVKIGGSKGAVAGVWLCEILLVLGVSVLLAAALTALAGAFGDGVIKMILS